MDERCTRISSHQNHLLLQAALLTLRRDGCQQVLPQPGVLLPQLPTLQRLGVLLPLQQPEHPCPRVPLRDAMPPNTDLRCAHTALFPTDANLLPSQHQHSLQAATTVPQVLTAGSGRAALQPLDTSLLNAPTSSSLLSSHDASPGAFKGQRNIGVQHLWFVIWVFPPVQHMMFAANSFLLTLLLPSSARK